MKRVALVGAILSAIGLVIPSLRNAGAQRRYYDPPRGMYAQQLVRRVAELERRVDRLESLLPGDAGALATVTVETAQQQVSNAKERLAYSEELFRKGYISQVQLDAERYEFRRAERVLQFAQATSDGEATQESAAAIAVLDAEYDLSVAQRQLQTAQRMSTSGFSHSTALDSYRRTIVAARKRLDEARAKASRE